MRKRLLINLILALAFLFWLGEAKFSYFFYGFCLAFAAISLIDLSFKRWLYPKKMYYFIKFSLFIVWEILVANLRVALEVLHISKAAKPGVIAVPLSCRSEVEITLLANLISLTPGSLTLDVSSDRKDLYVHSMFADDPEKLKQEIKQKLEKPLMELMQ